MKKRPLDSSPLFSTLLVKERLLLSKRMEVQKFSPGEDIFAQGALSETLYLIESGWVRLTREEKGERLTIATLSPGDLLGGEDFLLGRPYPVGAEAASEVTALKLTKADFLAVVEKEPRIGVKLSIALGSPVAGMAEYLAEHRLARTPLFSPLPTDLHLDIAERLRPKRYKRGEKICQAGDPGEAIYIVESGRIEALPGVEGEGGYSLGEGGLFGEMAILTGREYGNTYRAATQVTLWALSGEEFERLAQAHPLLRRVTAEHLRARGLGPPVAAEPEKVAAPRIRLSLPARRVSLNQGIRALVTAFRDLVRWQAHQRRATRLQLGIVVLLLIWLCGISAPTAVISSMTGGEGVAALLVTPTPTFTPSPMPTDTPTSTPTFTPMPTDTPLPSPTATPTLPLFPTPTSPPSLVTPVAPTPTPLPTATPIPPTPTSTPTPTPTEVVTRVYDVDDNERDMQWAQAKYGVWIEKAAFVPGGLVYRIVELRERAEASNIDVWVLDEAGNPIPGVLVRKSWPGEGSPVDILTNDEGRVGFGLGGGSYHPEGTSGAETIELVVDLPSDTGRGWGMLGYTVHSTLNIVFQLVGQ